MANPEVKILLKAVDEASKNIEKINKGLRGMETDANKAAAAQEKVNKQLKATQDASFKLAMGFGAVAAAGGAVLGSSIQLAARYETLGVVTAQLGKNVGKTEEEMRDLEQAVQDQGIEMIVSREAVALMIQSQIDLSKATDIARLAQDAAVIANINSSEAFKRVTRVIQTGSVIMARTIGLTVDFQGAYEDLAIELGTTADKLTALQKIEARTTEVLENATTIAGAYTAAMGTAGKNVLSLTRHIKDSQVMLGEVWLPVYADVIDKVTNSLKTWEALDQSQKDSVSTALGYVTAIAAVEAGMFLAIGTGVKLYGVYKNLAAGQAAISLASARMLAVLGLSVAAITIFAIGVAKATGDANLLNKAVIEGDKAAREGAKTYQEYKKATDAIAKSIDATFDAQGNLTVAWEIAGIEQENIIVIIKQQTEAEWELARSVWASDRAMLIRAGLIESDFIPAFNEGTEAIKGMSAEEALLYIQLDLATKAVEAEAKAFEEVAAVMEENIDWYQEYEKSLLGVTAGLNTVSISLGEISKQQAAATLIAEINKAYKEGKIDVDEYSMFMFDVGVNILDLDPAIVAANIKLAEMEESFRTGGLEIENMIETNEDFMQSIGLIPTDIQIKAEFDILDAMNNIATLRAEMADLRGWGGGGGYIPPEYIPPVPDIPAPGTGGEEEGYSIAASTSYSTAATSAPAAGATVNIDKVVFNVPQGMNGAQLFDEFIEEATQSARGGAGYAGQ